MNRVVQALGAAIAITAATVSQASAQICILFLCIGAPSGGGSTTPAPTPPAAPEIDVAQGLAALAILACAVFFLRERFLRQRAR